MKKISLFFSLITFLSLFTYCSQENINENQDLDMKSSNKTLSFKNLTEPILVFELELSPEETYELLSPILNQLPNTPNSILIIPNLDNGIASVYNLTQDAPSNNNSSGSAIQWVCGPGGLATCNQAADHALDCGASVSAYYDSQLDLYIYDIGDCIA